MFPSIDESSVKSADRHEQAAILQIADIKPANPRQRLRLGELLVAQGVLTPAQLEGALNERKRSGRRLGRILVEDGIATEEAIARALAVQLHIPYLELSLQAISPAVSRLLNEAQSRRFRAIPIDEAGSAIRVGMADPLDYQSYDEIQRLLGRQLDLVVVTESPQDGRFVVRVRGHTLDLRMSTMTTQYGESAVLRLLPHDGRLLELDRLGMPAAILAKVCEFISLAHGMLLVTGPTGSGKT